MMGGDGERERERVHIVTGHEDLTNSISNKGTRKVERKGLVLEGISGLLIFLKKASEKYPA